VGQACSYQLPNFFPVNGGLGPESSDADNSESNISQTKDCTVELQSLLEKVKYVIDVLTESLSASEISEADDELSE
jgi:hypothetical protein